MPSSPPILYVLDFNVGNKSDDPEDPWAKGRVTVGSASGGKLQTLIDNERMPSGIDVLMEDDGHIIWTQMGHPEQNDGMVQSATLDGENVKNIFSNGEIHTPKQVIIDKSNHKLYVCDREGLRVHRSNLDGSQKEILVQTGDWKNPQHVADKTIHCVGIAVDAKHGKFYWTQKGPSKGGQGRIFRANIEMPPGQTTQSRNDVELLFDNLPEPIDLEIDSDSQTLLRTDRGEYPKGNTLNKSDVSRDYDILARHLHEAIGLKVDEANKHIYVTDLGGTVYRYDLDGSNCQKLFENQGQYTGIALAHLPAGRAKALYGL
ncbi:low density lipo protein receptor [Teratosphaeria nubilosa]|uniref:Low density lipo protein receptor n=1 Tax=Teratosphaeria nubilosa TaxID=161662 RepID=A0A6G1LCW4_9PEZI|nr:low density lipo protein receptor [Teratosphaeria nubilosa]